MNVNNEKGAVKKRERFFCSAWLKEDIFKGWLAPHPENNKAFCFICNKTIRCCKTNLVQHSQTVSHIEKVRRQNQSLESSSTSVEICHKDKVKRAEIKLAAFFAEHNVAFRTVDHLVPLLKDIYRA